MKHLSWSSSQSQVIEALASLTADKGVIVGPCWVDIATPGELGRQLRRGRVSELVPGIYLSLQGDRLEIIETIGLLAVIDAARFAAAEKAFRERNLQPEVGHWAPRHPKHCRMVARSWGHSSEGPMGCGQIRGLDRTLDRSSGRSAVKNLPR